MLKILLNRRDRIVFQIDNYCNAVTLYDLNSETGMFLIKFKLQYEETSKKKFLGKSTAKAFLLFLQLIFKRPASEQVEGE